MKRIIVVLLSFSCIFPAAHDPRPSHEDVQRLQQLWHVFLWNGLQFDHNPHPENEPHVRRHPGRRGDKYRKPRFPEQQRYHKSNNRVDRSKHSQFNIAV